MIVKLVNLRSELLSLWSVVRPLSPASRKLYSTNVECSLQIHPFLKNKANFRKVKSSLNKVLTMDYVQLNTWSREKKQSQFKANSKPIQSQFEADTKPIRTQNKPNLKKAEMNVNKLLTKCYIKMSNWALYENEPNSNPNEPNLNTLKA